MTVRVQSLDFDVSAEIAAMTGKDNDIGAIASFIGRVRGTSQGRKLVSMELEHYPGMTEAELVRIEGLAVPRFQLTASLIIHRYGILYPGDNIVLVATASGHRQSALDGCAFLMDFLKTRAPFWKKEVGEDGSGDWVDAKDIDDHAMGRWES